MASIDLDSSLEEDDEFYGSFLESAGDPEKASASHKGPGFVIVKKSDIENKMRCTVDELTSLLDVPFSLVRAMLIRYHWNKERLLDKYWDETEQDTNTKVMQAKDGGEVGIDGDCYVCFDELKADRCFGLGCGHVYCIDCWGHYLKEKVKEGLSGSMTCITPDCKILVDDESFFKLVSDTDVHDLYKNSIIDGYVASQNQLSWCPGIECTNAVQITSKSCLGVVCTCGMDFCTKCKETLHDPITCELIKRWLRVSVEECASNIWIDTNTKPCPVCKAPIEKNEGCNHMTCRNVACHSQFCWICMNKWSSSHTCNKFPQPAKQPRGIDDPEMFIIRFDHYRNRYETHKKSWSFEQKLVPRIESLLQSFETKEERAKFQFLKDGVDVLLSCRRILQNTFVFAFFAYRSNNVEIFEDNQKDLERATEQLSKFFEQDMDFENLADRREHISEKYFYCDKRRKVLLDHLQEGFDNKYWKFSD